MDVFDRVKKVISVQLNWPENEISMESTWGSIGADSLDYVALIMALEAEFGMEIPDEPAEGWETVGAAVDYLVKEIG